MLTYGNIVIAALYLILAAGYISMLHIQNKAMATSVHFLLIISVIAHLCLMVFIGLTRGALALTSVYEALSALAIMMAVTLLFLELRPVGNSIGAFIMPLVFIIQIISAFGSRIPVLDKSITQMPLFALHTITTIIGYTFFVYSFILGVMNLYLLGRFKRKKFDDIFFELPPLEILEKLNIIALLAGFILLSLGLYTGARLAYLIWERIPFNDPKIFLSIILWCVYLLSLLAIKIFRLKGKMISLCSIVGFSLIVLILMVESLTSATLHKF